MAKLIKDWNELVGLESENYVLDIDLDMGCGWVRYKNTLKKAFYLSTHTFYGSKYKYSTEVLKEYGFDVELVSWDEIPLRERVKSNRDMLSQLSTEQFTNWVLFEVPKLSAQYTQSTVGLAKWLDSPYQGWLTLDERQRDITQMLNKKED